MMAGGSAPIDPWQAAHATYMKDLNAEEQALFAMATLDNLLNSTNIAQKRHQDESKSRYIFNKLEPLINAIDQYGKIAKAFEKYFEKIINMLGRIGDILPRCQVYQTLFPTNERLLQAISMAYLDVIDFCWTAKNIFRKMKKSTTVHFTLKLLWRDFNKDFEDRLNDFRSHVKIVEKQAGISNMIEASEERALIRFEKEVDKRNRLLSQLSSMSCVNKHLKEHEKRHKGTGSWLTKTVEFAEWVSRTRSDCLWCYGIPGSGKTVLMSYLVDELSSDAMKKGFVLEPLSNQDIIKRGIKGYETTVVYYYCDSSDSRSLKLQNILGTIIRQLLETIVISEALEQQIDKYFRPQTRVATEEELFTLLSDAAQNFSNMYLLIDGLDECDKEDIDKILSVLGQLLRSQRPLIKIALFSREEKTIANALKSYSRVRVSSDKISLDLSIFIQETVESKINCGRLCVSDPSLKKEVINALINGAQGMFLWVYFQLLDLCNASSEFEVRKTLQSLPQGMTATYTKILEKIAANRSHIVLAQKMFRWIVCAKRPMLLTELREAVAFEATDTSWNKEKVIDAVRLYQAGGNLVVIDKNDDTVRLAHHTVQQFLLQLPDHQSAIAIPFHFRLSEADLEAGEICVAYLSFSDFERQISTLHPDDAMPIITLPRPAAILERTTSQLGFNSGVSRLFNFACYLRTGQCSQETEKTTSIDFSKFAKLKVPPPQKLQEKYLFLNYAIENWIIHTSDLSEHNADTWKLFKKLAIDKPLPFDIRPWGDINKSNTTSCTALFHWASNAKHTPLMKLIAQHCFFADQTQLRMALRLVGFEIKAMDLLDGRKALIRATEIEHVAAVKLLLSHGADIEANNKNLRTILTMAASRGHTSVIKLSLAQGADIEANNYKGQTALCRAAKKGHADAVRLLLAKGADIKAQDKEGQTALWLAAVKGHVDTVRLLLAKEADVERGDNSKKKALNLTARAGHAAVVELLLNKGADVEGRGRVLVDYEGYLGLADLRTPLHEAALNGHAAVVKLLLAKGARTRAQDGHGNTALDYAVQKDHFAVVELLRAKRADIEAKINMD